MHFVVGSGPTGVIAAKALLDAGVPVTLLDVGRECEPERLAIVRRLAKNSPESWDPRLVEQVRGFSREDSQLPIKLRFGSRFPYAEEEMRRMSQEGTKCLQSFAKGGLSNLWGAALLPNRPEDFKGWPVSHEEMAPHYAAVAEAVKIAGAREEFEQLFPFYAPPAPAPRLSRQAGRLLERMRRRRAALGAAGMHFGQSRLALRTEDSQAGSACQYAGLCLSGCPYDAVWTSSELLDSLTASRGLIYRSGLKLMRLEPEHAGKIRLFCRSESTGEPETLVGDRVFLACGPISTARIVIDSLGAHGRTFLLGFQPYFLLPLLALENTPGVAAERLHTLAQLFVEIMDDRVSAHPVHLQIYSYDEFIRDSLAGVARRLGALGRRLSRSLEGRLLFAQGYLDSREVEPIKLTSCPGQTPEETRLRLSAQASPFLSRTIRRAVWKMARHAGSLGFLPLVPLLRVGLPGEGNHVGGLFPMRERPSEFESDVLGRLQGLPGVHLVDSSVLPSLASTTFTYTAMANAHRIAAAVGRQERQNVILTP